MIRVSVRRLDTGAESIARGDTIARAVRNAFRGLGLLGPVSQLGRVEIADTRIGDRPEGPGTLYRERVRYRGAVLELEVHATRSRSGPSGSATSYADRRASGRSMLSTWISAEARSALDRLTVLHGSQTAAIEAAILGADDRSKKST